MTNARQPATGHTISVNGVNLYYEKSGKGHPLLLLHGWTQTSAFWRPYADQFESEYEIYAIDLRGHGRSSPLTTEFSIQQTAQDITEFIRKLQLKNVKAIGLSFGGLALLELATETKDLIHSMAVISTSYEYDGGKAQKNGPGFTYENLNSSFKASLLKQHAGGESQVRAMFDPTLNYRINLSENQLKTIGTRVLIINGESDEIADIKQAATMHQLIPHSALLILPGTGHLAINDVTKDLFITTTKTFLGSDGESLRHSIA